MAVRGFSSRDGSDGSDDLHFIRDKMDSYAQKPSREGAKTHQDAMVRKDKWQNNQNDRNTNKNQSRVRDEGNRYLTVQAYYMKRFGKEKGILVKELLEMTSTEQLIEACNRYQINVGSQTDVSTQQFMGRIFSYFAKFEAEASTQAQQAQQADKLKVDTFRDAFGPKGGKINGIAAMRSEEAQERWLSMDSEKLKRECQKYGQPISESREENFQTLFRYQGKIQPRQYGDRNERLQGGRLGRQAPQTAVNVDAEYEKTLQKMMAKYQGRGVEEAAAEQQDSFEGDEFTDEMRLQSGAAGSFLKKNLYDVPVGPMRKLKPAPKFDIRAIHDLQKPKFQTIRTRHQLDQKPAVEKENESFDKSLVQAFIDAQAEGVKIADTIEHVESTMNPNLTFKKLFEKVQNENPALMNKEFLNFATSAITRLSTQNKAQVSQMLKQIDSMLGSELFNDVEKVTQIAGLALQTKTSMPNLLKLCEHPNFITQSMGDSNSPSIMDASGSCIVNFIKLAQNDFITHQISNNEFKQIVQSIQNKVEQVQELVLSMSRSRPLLRAYHQVPNHDPVKLLNRLVLLPTPRKGSLQNLLNKYVKALVAFDMKTENFQQGLFSLLERNYITARAMQLQNDKELQNDIRIVASSQRGVGVQNIAKDAMHLSYIISGKLEKPTELNNVFHLAGLLPESDSSQVTTKLQTEFNRIDVLQIKCLRLNLKKQLFSSSTLPQLRQMIELFEFKQQYSPLSVVSSSKTYAETISKLSLKCKLFQFSLNDLIRLQNVMLVSLVNPTFLFDEILSHKDSLATAVDKPVLKTFIEDILSRMMQHQVIFDHLSNSSSRLHRDFLPYTKDTFLVLSKLVEDLVEEGDGRIPVENFVLLNKILSLEQVTTKVFDSSEKANSVLGKFLTQQHELLQTMSDSNVQYDSTQAQVERLEGYDAIFKALRAVQPLIGSDQNLQETIAASIEVALANILRDIGSFSSNTNHLKSSNQNFPLDSLIVTNKSILDAIASLEDNRSRQVMNNYLENMPIAVIIDQTLLRNLEPGQNLQTSQQFVQGQRANILIKNAIENENWGKIERLSGPLITYFNQVLDSELLTGDRKNEFMELAERFLLKIRNSRSLYGVDLARFFKLIRQLQEHKKSTFTQGQDDIFDDLIMNVSCNLRTLGVNLLFQVEEDANDISIGTDSTFKGENVDRLAKDRQYKRMIFDMYKEVFVRNHTKFSDKSAGLSPLCVVFAELFDEMSFDERITCLKMLGQHQIDNYGEEFIAKLYAHYSQNHQISTLQTQNVDQFIQLADYWPKFLQNTALVQTLSNMDASRFSIGDQARVIKITTHKNLILPRFFQSHFNDFIKSSDRDQVKKLLANFMQSISYVGFTDGVNMEQITQVMRRIYKDPKNVDNDQLLNYFVTLALSNSRYQDFDLKSKEFVERALDLVEAQFTGTKQISVNNPAAKTGDKRTKLDLFLFNQISSAHKVYNKILDRNTQAFDETANLSKRDFFQKADNALTRKVSAWEDRDETKEMMVEAQKRARNEPSVDDFSDDEGVQIAGPKVMKTKHEKRNYERGSSDRNQGFDEKNFFSLRSTKLAQMAKKDNHLMLYSNVNTLDFIDINVSNVAKAWTVMFHFRGKSTESMLFEQFNSIAQRNTISKTKNHEVFNKLYIRLNEECYKQNLQLDMAGSCEQTGWPIDITLSPFFFKKRAAGENDQQAQDQADAAEKQLYAIIFLLQEEICYNSATRNEEPLGLQKLMLRHLSQISNFRVCTVDENMTDGHVESALAKIQDEFYPLLYSQRRKNDASTEKAVAAGNALKQADQLSSLDDFITESEDEDDIVDIPQSML